MAKGPLAVRWLDWTLEQPQAGAVCIARVEFENTGTIKWRKGIRLGYHWLDERGNPLIWDGERTEIPHLAPGEHATIEARVRAPIPPGRYGFALDLVAELRAWFSELGGEQLETTVDVLPTRRAGSRRHPAVGRRGRELASSGRRDARRRLCRRRRSSQLGWKPAPPPPSIARAVPAGAGTRPRLLASSRLPVRDRRCATRALAGHRRAPCVCAAERRAVDLRRADRADGTSQTTLGHD